VEDGHTKDFDEAAREAENQLQLFGLIFAQLARQDNELRTNKRLGTIQRAKNGKE